MGDIKHYAFNDQETGRSVVDARIARKAARESDLLAFELAIRIGEPASVMCSYNKVNGDWSCENDWLLNGVLKGAWKFPGFVVSDWLGTHSTEKAVLAGLDVEMPGEDYLGAPLQAAVTAGRVPMQRLNDMVHRLLRSMFVAGPCRSMRLRCARSPSSVPMPTWACCPAAVPRKSMRQAAMPLSPRSPQNGAEPCIFPRPRCASFASMRPTPGCSSPLAPTWRRPLHWRRAPLSRSCLQINT